MDHSTDQFLAAGGVTIFTQTWTTGDDSAMIILAHGFGEHSGRYDHVAAALNRAGFGVAALDHRGHGRSGGKRAVVTDMDVLAADFAMFRTQVARSHDLPQIMMGHSMGGSVVVQHLVGNHDPVKAVVLSAPYLRNAAPVPGILKTVAPIIGRFLPGLPTQKLDASSVSRDPAVVKAYEDDPLVYHGGVPAATGGVLLGLEDVLLPQASAITEPTLIMHGEADLLADVEGSRTLAGIVGATDIELKTYPGLYHEIFNEPEQDQVLADLTEWLDAHA